MEKTNLYIFEPCTNSQVVTPPPYPPIEDEYKDTKEVIRIRKQTTQWQKEKEKGQKDKQRFSKHRHKTKDRVARIPLKSEVNSGASEG